MKTRQIILNEVSVFDAYIMYQFLSKLTTPFKDTKAFKYGIIDAEGKILRKRNTLKTPEEKSAFTIIDVLIFNIKKLIEKIPGGKSMIATYAAALFLLKESKNAEHYEDPDVAYESFLDFFEEIMSDKKTFKSFQTFLREEKRHFSDDQTKKIGDELNVDWSKVDFDQFQVGLGHEADEHDAGDKLDVVDNLKTLGKIVLAHLKELPDYYTKLEKIEEDGAGGGGGGGGAGGVPANNAGSGHIAGLPPDSPPVYLKKKKRKTFKHF